MTLVTTQLRDTGLKERRRYQRVALTLSGRYLLRNHHEYPCSTINISPGGIAVIGTEKGLIGESVCAYFNDIGRIEGIIVRNFDNGFAVQMQLRPSRRDKFTRALAWLVSHHTHGVPDRRKHQRFRPYRRMTTLTIPDGHQYRAAVGDISLHGAALNVDAAPSIGSPVTIGQTSARVVRHFAIGIAVRFDDQLSTEVFNGDRKL